MTVSLKCVACPSREAHIELPETVREGDNIDVTIACANPACSQSVIYRQVIVEAS